MAKPSKPRKPSDAAAMIGLGGLHRDPEVIKARLQERDQRQATDNRTDVQRWLGDRPPLQSALAQNNGAKPKSDQVF